jgi:flavin-binding protein dodecin
MAVMKVVEVLANSTESFEDAVQNGVARVSKKVKGVKSAYINEQSVVVKGGKVTEYRVNLKVTFAVK